MQKFFFSSLFWLPWVLLLLIELLFRWGLWEPLIKPNSHVGSVVRVKKTEAVLPDQQVNWVTLGDSRVEIGFNHGRILAQRLPETGHVSLAVGGAHLATYYAAAEYAKRKYPNLTGFVIGVASGALQTSYGGDYELRKIEPFIQHYGWQKNPLIEMDWQLFKERTLPNASSLLALRDDVVDMIKNPFLRFEQLKQNLPTQRLYQPMSLEADICPFEITDLADCQRALQQPELLRENQKITFETYCDSDFARQRITQQYRSYQMTDQHIQQIADQWRVLFAQALSDGLSLVVVLLPEHSVMTKQVYPSNLDQVMQHLLQGLPNDKLSVLDYRDIFLNREQAECHHYHEIIHPNRAGADVLTEQLLMDLNLLESGEGGIADAVTYVY